MDTSKTYIKMCDKAEEIQKHKFDEGDYHGLLQNYEWSAHNYCIEDGFVGVTPQKIIWLPRQDQLQEIVGDFGECQDLLFRYYHPDNHSAFGAGAPSMEQLWLAFVMREKYDKVWNGEEWIK